MVIWFIFNLDKNSTVFIGIICFFVFLFVIAALKDLNSAIQLSKKHNDHKVLSLALAQRGAIYRLQGKNDEALNDFKLSASMGNSFAKHQMIALNPYAALCNQALSDLIQKAKCGQYD